MLYPLLSITYYAVPYSLSLLRTYIIRTFPDILPNDKLILGYAVR